MTEIRSFTVGQVAENCHFVINESTNQCVVVDPGEEEQRLLAALTENGLICEGILVTHTHFDHIGAVAPVARATGAEVWCPEMELPVLADVMSFVPWPGFGPYESWNAESSVKGGETIELAGMSFDVIHTPGHSPGHVTYVTDQGKTVLSGDVLFQGSVGRVDLPGGDWPTLLASIGEMVDRLPSDAVVYPGHGDPTTIGAELATNPFLEELRR
ncbi:MAG: MBL fold metallo-hydrolase [Solirubrobacterales bacterium]|nr:MBL fold metallo-hydrolase [Solirubrobacterales bacterium]